MPEHHTAPPNPDAPPTPVTFEHIESAAQRIATLANRTPVLNSRTLDEQTAANVYLKCENFQRTGSFKFRGAANAITALRDNHAQLDPADPPPHVLTYSSGNHAQAVALAAARTATPVTIIMPSDAPHAKRDATRAYLARNPAEPAELIIYHRHETTREALAEKLAAQRHVTIIPPYDHPDVIAGQGTATNELFQHTARYNLTPPDLLFVCTGGGGLLSGSAIAAKHHNPLCTVVGVEPETADDATRSFNTRTLHTVHDPPTIADGARTPSLGRYTFPLVLQHTDHMLTVSDEELIHAMRFALERLKILIEPAGALALAGLLRSARTKQPIDPTERTAAVIISGGNTDLTHALHLITRTDTAD